MLICHSRLPAQAGESGNPVKIDIIWTPAFAGVTQWSNYSTNQGVSAKFLWTGKVVPKIIFLDIDKS